MTILWETFGKTLAQREFTFRYPDGGVIKLPNNLKPLVASKAMAEQGRGTGALVIGNNFPYFPPPLNFWSLKYRDDILTHFSIGKVSYNGGDGLYDYCSFRTIWEAIMGYWAFVHRWPYKGIDFALASPWTYMDLVGHHFCPPGYEGSPAHAAWVKKTGYSDYTHLVLGSLYEEAVALLTKYGWSAGSDQPVPVPVPTPIPNPLPTPGENPFHVTNGMLTGPKVFRYFVKQRKQKRPQTIGVVVHATGYNEGISYKEAEGRRICGILDGWDNPDSYFAHILNMPDGTVWQAVDLNNVADHCYDWNYKTIGIENVNFGECDPRFEILGRFYRARWKPWEQSMAKSEMVKINGKYYPPFTPVQILNTRLEYLAIQEAYITTQWIKRHSLMPKNSTWDPGPLFQMEGLL